MDPTDILKRLSRAMLADESIAATLPGDVRAADWLGYPPCTEQQIADTEERLGVTLSPSLRSFYLISNGWRNINSFVDAILPVERIDYLSNIAPELAEVVSETRDVPGDLEYFDEQVTRVIRSIVLSTEGDATTTLIDPKSDVGEGEWNVGAWASWHPGMEWANADWWAYLARQGPTPTGG